MSILFDGLLGISATGNIVTQDNFTGDGSQLSNINSGNILFTSVSSNIIPSANVTYNLGNVTNQWKDVWVSNSTVYINSIPITVNANNQLTVDSAPVVLASNTAPSETANITTTANVNAGNLVVTAGGQITFPDGTTQNTAYANIALANFLPTFSGGFSAVGNINITGNLTANGNITTTGNATALANLYANNLISSGILTGTLSTSYQPNITNVGNLVSLSVSGTMSGGNLTTNTLTAGNVAVLGNVGNLPGNITIIYGNTSEFFGDIYGSGALYAGINDNTVTTFANTVAQFTGEYTDYAAVVFQNFGNDANSSTDYVATADIGTNSTLYIDFGMASSNFTGASGNNIGNVTQANDGYLYAVGNTANTPGGNLVIGTNTPNRSVGFIAGPGDSGNVILTVNSANIVVNGNLSANYLYGDGSNLSNIQYGNIIQNGNSNIVIGNTDGNININVAGNPYGLLSPYNISLGTGAGNGQGNLSVALGTNAGNQSQGSKSVAIGYNAGANNQGANSVAIGSNAASLNQGANSIAIGTNAGANSQGSNSVAIGTNAAANSQGTNSVAIGSNAAGNTVQGINSIAIGSYAGYNQLPNNSISINASGLQSNNGNASALYVVPIRTTNPLNNVSSGLMSQYLNYNTGTGEVQTYPTNSYSGMLTPYSGNLTASQIGSAVQINGSTLMPLANSVPRGSKFNFFCLATSAPVNIQGSDYIFDGVNQLNSITLYLGESLELTSRGPSATVWDVTGGTGILKNLGINTGYYQNGVIWKSAIPPNSAWGTTCTLNTYVGNTLQTISGYISGGNMYLATPTGFSGACNGQIIEAVYGSSLTGTTVNALNLTNSFTKVATQHTWPSNGTGSTYVFTFNLTGQTRVYRFTAIQTGSNSAMVSLERLS